MSRTTTFIDHCRSLLRRAAAEAAEGVISTAIAVLILAFVGAGMWVGFQALSSSACEAAGDQLEQSIGAGSTGAAGSSSVDCQP